MLTLDVVDNAGQGGGGGAGAGAGGAAGGAVVPGTQDAIQIVAQAALCFDNRQVLILLPAFQVKFIKPTLYEGTNT